LEIIRDEFDLITAENSCKMSTIAVSPWEPGTWINWNFWW
jgi:hypothetical protein